MRTIARHPKSDPSVIKLDGERAAYCWRRRQQTEAYRHPKARRLEKFRLPARSR